MCPIKILITYTPETWTMSKTYDLLLSLFERNVLRCIFGAKLETVTWWKRCNDEIYEIFNEPNIVSYIKVRILAWAGHLVRNNNGKTIKKIYLAPKQVE
jgi:hypothetical protein